MTSATTSMSNTIGYQSNRIEEEYNRIPDHGWERYYQEIRDKCEREADEKNYETNESSKPQNRYLNRYRDVNPYDHSRIIIHRGSVDYINANLVKLDRADRKYILTQGPLSDTVGHFWLMVWEQNTKAILMLNKLTEKNQVKCHRYWPCKKGAENAVKLDEVKLTVEYLRCEEYQNYCRRWFKLTDLETGQSREIIQFHYTTWPDFGIPSSPVAFLQFLKQVRDSGALEINVGPAVVHCSAGIGRSGTFCLVDCCLVLIEKEGENNVSVEDVLYELRRYRMGLIQTADQLYFSYKAIIEGIKLLKDPEFLNYKETPALNCSDDQQPDQYSMDETPPPLPPRTHSLQPLPMGNVAPGNPDAPFLRENATDALNNFINANMLNENISMTNRPLPPLPMHLNQSQNSFDGVPESESDENELYEDDDDDEDEEDDDELNVEDDDDVGNGDVIDVDVGENNGIDISSRDRDINNIGIVGINKNNEIYDAATTKKDDDHANANSDYQSQFNNKQEHISGTNHNNMDSKQDPQHTVKQLNGIDFTSNMPNNMSTENELKRRKRSERQANIEQKVNEIKRKQREVEESKNAAKKRRSWGAYIAAGVIVSLICVYAYSKLT